MQIRCLIVDDNQAFLDSARLLLEREGIAVVGVAATGTEALRLEQELRPDVVLVDIHLAHGIFSAYLRCTKGPRRHVAVSVKVLPGDIAILRNGKMVNTARWYR